MAAEWDTAHTVVAVGAREGRENANLAADPLPIPGRKRQLCPPSGESTRNWTVGIKSYCQKSSNRCKPIQQGLYYAGRAVTSGQRDGERTTTCTRDQPLVWC